MDSTTSARNLRTRLCFQSHCVLNLRPSACIRKNDDRQAPAIIHEDSTAIRELGFGLTGAPSIGMQSPLGIVTRVDKTHVDLPLCAKSGASMDHGTTMAGLLSREVSTIK